MGSSSDKVSGPKRFLFAGLGGLAPLLLNLVVIDLQTLLLDLTLLAVLSYLIRVLALFALGGIVGWLHKTECDPVKLFQLGIAAPALITAAINGGQVTIPEKPADSHRQSTGIVSVAYAQTAAEERVKTFSLPRETPAQQIYRGLFGATPKNVWFVIAGSHLTLQAAENQVAALHKRGFPADVYAPYGGNPYYAVVIGAQLTREEARQLRAKAVRAGLPGDTYLWTFPQRQ